MIGSLLWNGVQKGSVFRSDLVRYCLVSAKADMSDPVGYAVQERRWAGYASELEV